MDWWILDDNDEPKCLGPISVETIMQAQEFLRSQRRTIRRDWFVEWGVWVSTVFLCVDHRHSGDGPPILFESMVFPVPCYADLGMRRYCTKAEALAGHEELCARVLAGGFKEALAEHEESCEVMKAAKR